jgi:diguanylate cyclase (GGDEF)-like protein/putative nucleotidyltransferase with HDIG domain
MPFVALKAELKSYKLRGKVLLVLLAGTAAAILANSAVHVVNGGTERLLFFAALAVVVGLTTARYPLPLPGSTTTVSVSDPLMFLAVVTLGPHYAALLAIVEALVGGLRAKLHSVTIHIFNVSNLATSLFVSGVAYEALVSYLKGNPVSSGVGSALAAFALPLLALAVTDYLLHTILISIVLIARGARNTFAARDALPWEPVAYLACATVAGLVHFAYVNKGLVLTAVVVILVLPVPIIIYYTFKTYREKLNNQQNHYSELTGIYDSILEMLAMAIDAKDDVTHDHIQRVKLFACRIGQAVGLSDLEIEALKAGALLHDIGKIGVPAYILNKPGKLTEHEFEQMKLHTIIGADMLSNVPFRYPVVPIVRHHHERWDGRGYPDGLAGEDIPKTARILTLVDNYDALRSDRPYKTGMTREEALSYIKENAGSFFDPTLVELFLSMVDQLENEAQAFKPPPNNKRREPAIAKSSPAAGYELPPNLDRAAKALSSIAETNQRVTALYEMARTLASHLSLEDTVAILSNRLSKLVPFTTCAISLFDPSRSEFEVIHATGLHADRLIRRRMPAEAGITGWAITNQRPMYNTNPVLDLGFLGQETASHYKGVMVFPMVRNQEALGAIAVYSTEIAAYGSDHIQLMESALQPASDAIYNALAFEQAHRTAFTDSVTGTLNTRSLSSQFERELTRSQKVGESLSILVVSLDNLQDAAAAEGVGADQLVAQFSRLLRYHVRESDVLARYSANTFVAMLVDTGLAQAREIRGRIRDSISELTYKNSLFVALGAATSPDDGTTFDDLFNHAQADLNAYRQNLDLVPTSLTDIVVAAN